jgi:hypothetical protein
MVGMMPVGNPDGTWKYPNSGEVLKAVGLKMVGEYIAVRVETIARFIMDQPIFALCRDGERRRGSATRTFWWEQPLTLDSLEALPNHEGVDGDGA